MRRVWAAVAATWALLAIVAVLAWSHPPVQAPPAGSHVVVVKGKNGVGHAVVVAGGLATHTTTHTSPPAGGG